MQISCRITHADPRLPGADRPVGLHHPEHRVHPVHVPELALEPATGRGDPAGRDLRRPADRTGQRGADVPVAARREEEPEDRAETLDVLS